MRPATNPASFDHVTTLENMLLEAHRFTAPPYTDLPAAYYEERSIVLRIGRSIGKSMALPGAWMRSPLEAPGQPVFMHHLRIGVGKQAKEELRELGYQD